MIDIRKLKYFVMLAEERNFTRAAERAAISQPPFSRAIAQLESELDCQLVVRGSRELTLTAAGLGLLKDARAILHDVAQAGERARKIAEGKTGVLRIGFGGTAVYGLWAQLLSHFSTRSQGVELKFHTMPVSDQIEALRNMEIDVGLVRLPVLDEVLETKQVHEEKLFVACLEEGRFGQSNEPIAIRDLSSERFVTYEPRRGFSFQSDLHALCRMAGFEPLIAHEASSTETVLGIVACGEGVAIVPESAARLNIAGVIFRELATSASPKPFEQVMFGLAWHRFEASAVTRDFVRRI